MKTIEVGDLVQWQCMGTYVFQHPKTVTKIVAFKDEQFVYIEGLKVGIPIDQIIRVTPK